MVRQGFLVWFVVIALVGTCFGGAVFDLNDKNFDASIAENYWLVEFYAPWCGHCKKLAPILDEVAASVADDEPLRIGKLDATQNKNIASAFNITGFPTLVYLKNGISGRYDGPRTADSISTFLRRMSSPSLTEVSSIDELDRFYNIHPIAFVLSLPTTDYIESDGWLGQFGLAANKLHLHASFVTITDSEITSPRISKHENGRPPVYFTASAKISASDIEKFVEEHNVPFINEIDNHNFKKLASLNRVMVMVAVDYSKKSVTDGIIRALDSAATGLSSADKDKFIFGHIDGVKWSKFLRQYEVESTPTIALVDVALDLHLTESLVDGEGKINLGEIEHVLNGYLSGARNLKPVKPPGIVDKALKKMRSYYPWSLLCVLPILLMVLSYFLPYPDDGKQKKA